MINYEDEEDVVFKIDYLVKNGSRIFQLIVPDDNDVSYVPEFNFPYLLIDCQTNMSLARRTEWEKILESEVPVIFTNTSYMFKQFEKEQQILNQPEADGAALFAQYFYYYYRDSFWENNKSKLIFMVAEKDVLEM